MAEWTKCIYSRGTIDKAGAKLMPWWDNRIEKLEDLGAVAMIVQNWRTSHGFPLNSFQMILRTRAKRIDSQALIGQRLKRLSSIMDKLVREPHMRLTQMQDLGGCRAIMSNIESVFKLASEYGYRDLIGDSAQRHYDYISNPKPDGYRSFHIVDRYWSDDPKYQAWNGHKVEIQLRTQLQHSLATAVETVTTFTHQALKFGGGLEQWRRFFVLMGSVIAISEGTPLVEGAPPSEKALLSELKEVTKELNVETRLRSWRDAMKIVQEDLPLKAKWLLLVLNIAAARITVTPFDNRELANQALAKLEQSKSGEIDAVLVWVNTFKQLRKAYPNYYADTEGFLAFLGKTLRRS